MVKTSTPSLLYNRIKSLESTLNSIDKQLSGRGLSMGKRDYLLRYRLQIVGKLRQNLLGIKDMLEYTQVTIFYKLENEPDILKQYHFFNTTVDEASFVFNLYARMRNQKVIIQEIKTRTFSCPDKL